LTLLFDDTLLISECGSFLLSLAPLAQSLSLSLCSRLVLTHQQILSPYSPPLLPSALITTSSDRLLSPFAYPSASAAFAPLLDPTLLHPSIRAIARGEEPNLGPSILTGRNEIDRMYMKSDKELVPIPSVPLPAPVKLKPSSSFNGTPIDILFLSYYPNLTSLSTLNFSPARLPQSRQSPRPPSTRPNRSSKTNSLPDLPCSRASRRARQSYQEGGQEGRVIHVASVLDSSQTLSG
jgi:hypothetical protein